MECPTCGRANGPDRLECEQCETLLVDVFRTDGVTEEPSEGSDTTPDPVVEAGSEPGPTPPSTSIGPAVNPAAEEQEILQVFRQMSVTANPAGSPDAAFQYTGDLPRLFRFGERYQILDKLGEGGMGRVYKAMDLELDRPVALKTIRSEKGTGPEILKRFKQELVLARKVTHKNVIRIYDLGESEGMKFFTMELVEGCSLRDTLKEKGKLSVKESIDVLKQMLAGLAEAHRQGVVHRDLKPQNIMVDGEGTLRIMDFGIARTADTATITGTSEMMGTPDYISPEQVKGEDADAKSDLYSAGVILYELLTGQVPFAGDTAVSKIVARLQAKPTPPRTLDAGIPSYVERIVLKLMEVDPELRYQSAEQVLEDIEREQVDRSPLLRLKKLVRRRRGWLAAAIIAAAAGLGFFHYANIPDSEAIADIDATTIAVLPFHNLAGAEDLDWMQQGIPEMLVTDVSQLRSLRPVLAERMTRILRDLGKNGQTRFDEETLQVVSQMASADYALHGSFIASQGRLRMDLNLRESTTGVSTPVKIDGDAAELFDLVDAITENVSKELDLDSGRENRPLSEVSTASVEAFRVYHEGLTRLQDGANQAAIPLFQEAITLDENFAMAHAKLAEALFQLEDPSAEAAIARAVALLDDVSVPLSERYQIHAIAALVRQDPQTAVDAYRRLSDLYPADPKVLMGLGNALENLGEVDEALDVYRRVVNANPDYGAALLGLGRLLVGTEQTSEAVAMAERAIESGDFDDALDSLGLLHAIIGASHRTERRYAKALEHFQQSLAYRRDGEDQRGVVASLTNMSLVYREMGRIADARRSLAEALALAQSNRMRSMESFVLQDFGNLALQSGRLGEARDYYESSLQIEWDLGQKREIVYRLDALAEVYRLRGEYIHALVFLTQAESFLDRIDDPSERAFNRSVRGQTQMARGNYDEALQDLLRAIPALEQTTQSRDMIAARQALAKLYIQQGRFREAVETIERTIAITNDNLPSLQAAARIQRIEYLLAVGETYEATRELEIVTNIVEDLLFFEDLPAFHLARGFVLQAKGDTKYAASEFAEARQEASQREQLARYLEASNALARTNIELDRVQGGVELADEARAIARAHGHRQLEADASIVAADGSIELGNYAEAQRHVERVVDIGNSLDSLPVRAHGHRLLSRLAHTAGDAQMEAAERRKWAEVVDEITLQVPAGNRESYRRRNYPDL